MKLININSAYPLIASAALFCAAGANAQLNESINVEGKYVPEIIHADRLNTYPTRLGFKIETNPLNYETSGVPASFIPEGLTLPATGWRASRTPSRYRGYIDLGLGSWLNSNLSAGYSFIDNDNTRFGIRLQHNSVSLWKPDMDNQQENVTQFRYDEAIGIYASHNLGEGGCLSGAIDYHLGYFNYYGYNPVIFDGSTPHNTGNYKESSFKAPTQTLNDIAVKLGWNTRPKIDDISAYAQLGVRYFGYRRTYDGEFYHSMWQDPMDMINEKGEKETDISLNGGLRFPTSSTSAIGFDADVNVVAYSGADAADNNLFGPKPDTYGIFTLTPYYSFTRSNISVRLGADLDFAANAGIKGNRYGVVHIAPDVKADYRGKSAAVYLHLLGGSRMSTLADNSALDYYQCPYISNTAPVYTPLDARLGANFGPFAGFSAEVSVAYRISRGELIGGLYMLRLNNDLPLDFFAGENYTYNSNTDLGARYNIHGFSADARLSYRLGNILTVTAAGSYQPQKGKTGYFNGYDRPRITADASIEVAPVEKLKLKLAYQYRGVRNCYSLETFESSAGVPGEALVAYRLPDITMLNLGASYSFTDRFSLWAQADNLLNRHDCILPSLPQNGIIISGGFSFLF